MMDDTKATQSILNSSVADNVEDNDEEKMEEEAIDEEEK